MKLRDDVHTFDVDSEAFAEPLSIHILETDEATLLFGAGMDDTVEETVSYIRDYEVDTVVVEHGDRDHYAGVPGILDTVDVSVVVPERDAPELATVDVVPDRTLVDGDEFAGVRAIAVPGHTPGNMAFLYDDVLVAGDTVEGSDSIYADNGYWGGRLDVVERGYNSDEAAMRENVRILLDYNFDVVLVTHGSNVLSGGYEAVERLVTALRTT